jgi:hypothetical protein
MKEYMKVKRNGNALKKREIKYPPNFEKWWKLYPARKGIKAGKEAALEEFEKAIRSEEDFDKLMRATERYQSVELPKDGERFLKKNYWKDWMPPSPKDVKPGVPTQFQDSDGSVWEMRGGTWQQVAQQKK